MNEEQPREETLIKYEYDGIKYSINEKEKTASVIGSTTAISGNFFIPRSIIYEKCEYPVTSISEGAFMNSEELISIQFASNSKLKVIKKNAFANTKIEKLSIPSNFIEFEKGWCFNTQKLTKVEVSSENKRFTVYDDKFILSKSSNEKENFDILVFASRDITEARIPSFIEIIGSHAFNYCINLKSVEFSKNSKLRIIEDGSFSNTQITRIDIPIHVTKIGRNAFCDTKLQHIEIHPNSELQKIEKDCFSFSSFENILITPNVIELDDCFSFTNNLNEFTILPNNKRYISYENKFILGKSKLEMENYDVLVFAVRDIEEAIIPSFVKIIAPYAFCECQKLQTIEFYDDSELRIIDNFAFYCSSLKKINIPSHVTCINESAFEGCFEFQEINIPANSELQVIETNAFFNTKINSLFIPSKLTDLKEGWDICLHNLNKISVMSDNERYATYEDKYIIGKSAPENEYYDVLVFCVNDIQTAIIPDFIKIIGPYAFCNCDQLQQVITTENSQLQTIDHYAFGESSIQRINVPQGLKMIGQFAFFYCMQLQEVIIPENCQLEEISKSAFENCNLQSILIPPQVKTIKESAFLGCRLQEIEIPKESKLEIIEKNAFFNASFETIYIPSNIIELKEGWCCYLRNLTSFTIASKLFKSYEDKYIIGKSMQKKDEFDVLVLSVKNIEHAIIPNFIKIIGPNAFENCNNIQKVEIEKGSKLETIDNNAFINCSFEKITIPYHVKYLKQRAFFNNQKLKKVEIPSNSQIKIIEPKTFGSTEIQCITIPQNVVTISQTAFLKCHNLQIVEIEENSQLKYIDHNMFVDCTQIKIMIPPKLSEHLFFKQVI